MAIDIKNLQVRTRRVIVLFVASCSTFVKKYPVVSGILSLFFLLYLFLPSLFVFLIFGLPILIFIVGSFRLIFRIHQQNLKNAKGVDWNSGISSSKPSIIERDGNFKKRRNSYSHPQSVRRRNAKEKQNHVHFHEDVDEKDMVFSTIDNNDLVDKAALMEETPKEIREVEVESITDRPESSSAASQRSKPGYDDGYEIRINKFRGERFGSVGENSDDGEDEDEEEALEDGNKAVEWTEDDQKNLMDLGFSEMERNKRLESLIAKRKARKLLSLQVRRTLMNIGRNEPSDEIASILIPKPGLIPRNKSIEALFSPTPGSAPSVLLPVHNPFDLPYDPQEEKPNLSGGFQEELVEAHQNDTVFCRHESFSLGAISSGPWEFQPSRTEIHHCPNLAPRPKAWEIPEYSRFKKQSGKEDVSEVIQTESSQEDQTRQCINNSHDHLQQSQATEQALNLINIDPEEGSNEIQTGSKLDGDDIHETNSSSSSEVNAPFSTANRDDILRSLSFSVRRNAGADRETKARRDGLSYDEDPSSFEKKRGNEPFLDDYKGAYHNHTPSHSIASDLQVEVSEVSSPVEGTNSSSDGETPIYDKDGDVDEEEEGNTGNEEVWVGSSQLKSVEENESRSGEVREVSEQDIIEVGFSRISQKSEDPMAPGSSQNHSDDFVDKVDDEVEPPSSRYSSEVLSNENSGLPTLESAKQSTVESGSQLPDQTNPEEPSYSGEQFAIEEKVFYDVNDRVVLANEDNEIMEFIQHTYGENRILMNQETLEDLSAPNMEDDTSSVDIAQGNSGLPENDQSNSSESFLGEFERRSETEHIAEGSDTTGNNSNNNNSSNSHNNNNSNIQDSKAEGGLINVASSGAIAIVMQPEIVSEQGPSDSSSSASLTSTTEEKLQIRVDSLSNYRQTSSTEDLQLNANMEPSIPLERYAEELDFINNGNEPVVLISGEPNPPAVLSEEVVEQVAAASSLTSSPNSVLQKKFSVDLASISSFEDMHMVSQQSEVEMEENNVVTGLAAGNLTVMIDENTVDLTEDSMNCSINDTANNEGPGDGLESSNNRADVGLLEPMEENEESETNKGVEDFGESQISKDVEGPSKLDNTIDNTESTEVIQGNSGNLAETNVVGTPIPVEQHDDTNIVVPPKESK